MKVHAAVLCFPFSYRKSVFYYLNYTRKSYFHSFLKIKKNTWKAAIACSEIYYICRKNFKKKINYSKDVDSSKELFSNFAEIYLIFLNNKICIARIFIFATNTCIFSCLQFTELRSTVPIKLYLKIFNSLLSFLYLNVKVCKCM